MIMKPSSWLRNPLGGSRRSNPPVLAEQHESTISAACLAASPDPPAVALTGNLSYEDRILAELNNPYIDATDIVVMPNLVYNTNVIGNKQSSVKIGQEGESLVEEVLKSTGKKFTKTTKQGQTADFVIDEGQGQVILVEVKKHSKSVGMGEFVKLCKDVVLNNATCALYISLDSGIADINGSKFAGLSLRYVRLINNSYMICAILIMPTRDMIIASIQLLSLIIENIHSFAITLTGRNEIAKIIDDVIFATQNCFDIDQVVLNFLQNIQNMRDKRNMPLDVTNVIEPLRRLNLCGCGHFSLLKFELYNKHNIIDGRRSNSRSSSARNRDRAAVDPQVG